MLQVIGPDIWHEQHGFSSLGIRISSRMTVVRLADGWLWLSACLYMGLMGVYHRVAVPNGVRLLIRDREALGRSIRRILRWDIERVVVAHNTILQQHAYASVERALLAVP
jgi:hypothetical protein